MQTERFRVIKVTVKTGCDLEQQTVKGNLSKVKAQELRDSLESKNEAADFNPHSMVSYIVEPAA